MRPTVILENDVIPIFSTLSGLIFRGVRLGAQVALFVSFLYAVVVGGLLGISVSQSGSGGFQSAVMIGVTAWILGVIPALLVGTVSGWLIEVVLTWVPRPLTTMSAIAVGIGIGILVLSIPTILITLRMVEEMQKERGMEEGFFLFLWYLPCLFALLGLGWVAYQLNEKMPVS
jgi:hypothetical protein